MEDLSSTLAGLLNGRTAFVGIGNTDRGDDGLGVRLAEALRDAGLDHVLIADTTPENYAAALARERYDTVILLDAVRSGGEPGSVILMEASGVRSAFPQVSTHRLSLGTLAGIFTSGNETKVWLLGICPASIKTGRGLSGAVRQTVGVLAGLIAAAKGAGHA